MIMKKNFIILCLLSISAIPACATKSTDSASAALATFSQFISAAEAAAANNQNIFVVSNDPYVGRDYAVSPGRISKGVFVSYNFRSSPCVTATVVEANLINLGYVKLKRSADTHETRSNKSPNAEKYAVQETYRYGTMNGTRSLNLDYSIAGGNECVSTIFIDFPE